MTAMPEMKPFDVSTIKDEPTHLLLVERGLTHGDFGENAVISQTLKHVFRDAAGWDNLINIEREALDMIALKISRILSGRSMERQHWEDIVGYAKLVQDKCA